MIVLREYGKTLKLERGLLFSFFFLITPMLALGLTLLVVQVLLQTVLQFKPRVVLEKSLLHVDFFISGQKYNVTDRTAYHTSLRSFGIHIVKVPRCW